MYMSDTLNLVNSIWPNGMKVDSDGHAVFYPLGTKKIKVPTSSTRWPKGDKLVSPFVYDKDDKLVGFCDTKALAVSKNTTIYLPYKHIEAEFSAIEKGQLQIHAPKATTTKKVSWKNSGVEDIVEVQFKYKDCKTVDDAKNVGNVDYYGYLADISNGTWSEPLWDLEQGGKEYYEEGMFYQCTSLTSFASDLPNLTDGKAMFFECSGMTSFSSDLSSLTAGDHMFYKTNLSEFSSDLPSLTDGSNMFSTCSQLESFSSDLSSLTNGNRMFEECFNLTLFSSKLPSLTDGRSMFSDCANLTSFSTDLSTLMYGNSMFYDCENLTSFTSDLPNLTDGSNMFAYCDNLTSFSADFKGSPVNLSNMTNGYGMFDSCYKLTSFSSDLSSLTNGYRMFNYCSNLTSFKSDLSSLTDGDYMFYYCKLNATSIKSIIDTINTYSAKLTLGMGCNSTTADKNLFAQEVGYADMDSLLSDLHAVKGWTVKTQYNGRPTTTYGLRRPSEDTLPVFVQLEETEERAEYTSLDDSKKYRLNYFHETTGSTEGFTQFNSLEEAIESLNIKPIERN